MKNIFILIHNPDGLSCQIKGVFLAREDAERRKEELNSPRSLFIEEHEIEYDNISDIYPKNTPGRIELRIDEYLEESDDNDKAWQNLDFQEFDLDELCWTESFNGNNPQYIREDLV